MSELDAAASGWTLPRKFVDLLGRAPDSPALHSMTGDTGWNVWTVQDYADQVARAAAGLTDAGVSAGERILLMMRNRPDFHWFDTAAQFIRVTPVSIYNSSSSEEISFLAGHAEARVAIVEDSGVLDRILAVRHELPLLERIYVIEPPDGDLPPGVMPASDLLEQGSADLAQLAAATVRRMFLI